MAKKKAKKKVTKKATKKKVAKKKSVKKVAKGIKSLTAEESKTFDLPAASIELPTSQDSDSDQLFN